jgi:D-glycero-D-manno-heptose 1,7-bisphosphate phosphatase
MAYMMVVFLDRDGTIIEEKDFIKTPEEIEFIPRSMEAIRILKKLGYKIIAISNQSGIGRGILTLDMVTKVNESFLKRLERENVGIDGLYFCPHHPEENCDCRKPKTGLIQKAAVEQKLDLKDAVVIGDKLSDVELGKNLGVKTVLVLTGYGKTEAKKPEIKQIKPDFIADDLYGAVIWLKNTSFKESN